jgi:hypothetical protein
VIGPDPVAAPSAARSRRQIIRCLLRKPRQGVRRVQFEAEREALNSPHRRRFGSATPLLMLSKALGLAASICGRWPLGDSKMAQDEPGSDAAKMYSGPGRTPQWTP